MSYSVLRRNHFLIAIILVLISGFSVALTLSPTVQKGINWLQAQVQSDGSLQGESNSIATPHQNRSETSQTLLRLKAAQPNALAQSIANDTETNTEYLARQIISKSAIGQDSSAMINLLISRQNDDGGFGAELGYSSNPLDTAWVLLVSETSQIAAPKALAYLKQLQQPNGAYQASGRDDLYVSAYVLNALARYAERFDLKNNITPLVAFLNSQQSADGTWNNSAFMTAVVYQALHDFVPAQPLASQVANYLTSSQNSDGSWGLDPYSTAVVLRALQFTEQLPVNPTQGSASGKIIDAQTGSPLEGVAISFAGASSATAQTNSLGAFQLSNVNVGSYTITISLPNYSSIVINSTIRANQSLDLGVLQLVKNTQATTGTIKGVIIDANSLQGLAGVFVSAGSLSTTTDSQGNYQIANIPLGDIQLTASKLGYLSNSAKAKMQGGMVLVFSPSLAAASNTPTPTDSPQVTPTPIPTPKSTLTNLTGLVIDAGTNQAIANAKLSVIDGKGTQNLTVDAAGYFKTALLTPDKDGGFALQVSAPNYLSLQTYAMATEQQILELGQLRLRKAASSQLLPDLTVLNVSRKQAITEPQQLTLSGMVAVTLSNAGTAASPANVKVLAFYDSNNNGVFDPATEAILGTAVSADGLAVGATQIVMVPVSGKLPFRDAPISVLIDSDQKVPQLNLASHVGSTAQESQIKPDAKKFQPTLKWQWSGSPKAPGYNQVMMSPVVARFIDENGDGVINDLDSPSIIFSAFSGSCYDCGGYIFVVNGRTGIEQLAITSEKVDALVGLAIADINNDGKPLLIGSLYGGTLAAFNQKGEVQWRANKSIAQNSWGAIAIADMGLSSRPNIIYGKDVFDADGKLIWSGSLSNSCSASSHGLDSISVVASLQANGKPNLICGGSAYSNDGKLLWSNSSMLNGQSAIGDFNLDGKPEIVVMHNSYVGMLDHEGRSIWGPVYIPGGGGGPPTIADMNGDGIPDIGIAGANYYTAFKSDGSIIWQVKTQDFSSRTTGSTVFDFDGDGHAEVVYADETTLRVMNGRNGEILFSLPNPSGTAAEYPLVVDVDSDQHADLVVVSNNYYFSGTTGVRVFKDTNNAWVNTRSIWNQHSYHITNINDDATVPQLESNSWQVHNTYRSNKLIGLSATAVPDLTASYLRILDNGGQSASTITVRIGNAGGAPTKVGIPVAIYSGSALLGNVATTKPLESNQFQDLTFSYAGTLAGISSITVIADDDGTGKNTITDFDRSNNSISLNLSAMISSFNLSATTDKVAYGANTPVIGSILVANHGSFDGSTDVLLSIQTSDGTTVAELPTQTVQVNQGKSTSINTAWNTGTLFVGDYQLSAQLLSSEGKPLQQAIAKFSITADAASNAFALAKLSTDKASYNANDIVALTSRTLNLTSNLSLENLTVLTRIFNPDGTERWQKSESLPTLLANQAKDYAYHLNLVAAGVGEYRASLQVLNSNGVVLAQQVSTFTVSASSSNGSGLTGTLTLNPNTVYSGEKLNFSYAITNQGNSDLSSLPVTLRLVDPANSKVIAEWSNTIALPQTKNWIHAQDWATNVAADTNLVAVLSVQVAGKELILAQSTAKVIVQPVKLDVKAELDNDNRVLVWFSCGDNWWGSMSPLLNNQPCFINRKTQLQTLLDPQVASYQLVSSEADFLRELRSGRFNQYWLLGSIDHAKSTVLDEIREMVNRGNTIVMDSNALSLNNYDLIALSGSRENGTFSKKNQLLNIKQGLFDAATLPANGTSLCITPSAGATVQATLTGGVVDGSKQCPVASSYPAILTSNYGKGQSIIFNFDLLDTLQTGGVAWLKVFNRGQSSLVNTLPIAYPLTDLVPTKLTVKNQGIGVTLAATSQWPIASPYLYSVPLASITPAQVTWTSLPLAEQQQQRMKLGFTAAAPTGQQIINNALSLNPQGQTQTYGHYPVSYTIVDLETLLQKAGGEISNLQTNNEFEKTVLTNIRTGYNNAVKDARNGQYCPALLETVTTINDLLQLTVDTRSSRLALDDMLHNLMLLANQCPLPQRMQKAVITLKDDGQLTDSSLAVNSPYGGLLDKFPVLAGGTVKGINLNTQVSSNAYQNGQASILRGTQAIIQANQDVSADGDRFFLEYFGFTKAQIKQKAYRIIGSQFASEAISGRLNGRKFVWVDGDINVNTPLANIGFSAQNQSGIVLIVNGKLTLAAGMTMYGVLYGIGDANGQWQINSGAPIMVNGLLAVEGSFKLNGSIHAVDQTTYYVDLMK